MSVKTTPFKSLAQGRVEEYYTSSRRQKQRAPEYLLTALMIKRLSGIENARQSMTLEELEKMDCEFLTVKLVAQYLHSGEQHVRCAMRKGVPWGYVMNNADFRIPRRRFVAYHRGAEL